MTILNAFTLTRENRGIVIYTLINTIVHVVILRVLWLLLLHLCMNRKEEAYLMLPRHLPPGYFTKIGKLLKWRNPRSRTKFYILLESERDPDITREVCSCSYSLSMDTDSI